MKIQNAQMFRIIRTVFGSFLIILGIAKVLQDFSDIVDQPVYTPYIVATLAAIWNTLEVMKEIRKSNAQVAN